MIVREIMTATIIEDEVQVRLRDVGHTAEAEVRIGTGAGVVVPDVGIGTEDDRPQEPHLHPPGAVLDLIHAHRPLVVPGGPGRTPLPPRGILEVTAPCHHLQGGDHHLLPVDCHLLPVVIAAAQLVTIGDRVHLQGHLRGRGLLQENAAVLLPLVLRCQ